MVSKTECERVRKIQSTYYNIADKVGPRLHIIIGFFLIFGLIAMIVLPLLGMVTYELLTGNMDFLLDWLNALTNFYIHFIQPLWVIFSALVIISIPFTLIVIVVAFIILLIVVLLAYNILLPKISVTTVKFTTDDDGKIKEKVVLNNTGPYMGRVLWMNDSKYLINRINDFIPKMICNVKKIDWLEPTDRTGYIPTDEELAENPDLKENKYLVIHTLHGFKSVFRAMFLGFSFDDRHEIEKVLVPERRDFFTYSVERESNSSFHEGSQSIRDTPRTPKPVITDPAILANAVRGELESSHETTQLALKSNVKISASKELNNVYLELPMHERERMQSHLRDSGLRECVRRTLLEKKADLYDADAIDVIDVECNILDGDE